MLPPKLKKLKKWLENDANEQPDKKELLYELNKLDNIGKYNIGKDCIGKSHSRYPRCRSIEYVLGESLMMSPEICPVCGKKI